MTRLAKLSLLIGALSMTGTAAAAPELAKLLPDQAEGYSGQEEELYDHDNLFELINGGAEVYRALNVRFVLSRRYARAGAADIIVDIFDMGSSADAFGAYHHDMREGESAGVGQESELIGGTIYFWKGQYFVSVVALAHNSVTSGAVVALANGVAERIEEAGQPPAIVGRLPQKGLVKSQVHYFHNWRLLSRHYQLADHNVLDLDDGTEGVIARYRRRCRAKPEDRSPALLLIRYRSAAAAEKAGRQLLAAVVPEPGVHAIGLTSKGGWAGVRVVGDLLIAVVDAELLQQAAMLLEDAASSAN